MDIRRSLFDELCVEVVLTVEDDVFPGDGAYVSDDVEVDADFLKLRGILFEEF